MSNAQSHFVALTPAHDDLTAMEVENILRQVGWSVVRPNPYGNWVQDVNGRHFDLILFTAGEVLHPDPAELVQFRNRSGSNQSTVVAVLLDVKSKALTHATYHKLADYVGYLPLFLSTFKLLTVEVQRRRSMASRRGEVSARGREP